MVERFWGRIFVFPWARIFFHDSRKMTLMESKLRRLRVKQRGGRETKEVKKRLFKVFSSLGRRLFKFGKLYVMIRKS